MAGHSQFKNIMYRKSAQDKKRAREFARFSREISSAVQSGGTDPGQNPRLRAAIQTARDANMPKDNIQRAIRKSVDKGEGAGYQEITYQGYGPGGAALIVETVTDNRNRTAAAVRSLLSKHGGSLADVSFLFRRRGVLVYRASRAQQDDLFAAAVECGAEDMIVCADEAEILCPPEALRTLSEALTKRLGPPKTGALAWRPTETVSITDPDQAQRLLKLLEALEESEDVQQVSSNFEIESELFARLTT